MERSSGRRAVQADALLYALSAVFAGAVALWAAIPQYREWGRLACGVYAGGALAVLLAARAQVPVRTRAWVAAAVFAGAALLPLTLQTVWRAESNLGSHAQSEVLVVEEAAKALLDGRDPYAATYVHGSLWARPLATQIHVPYLPGMLAFGLARAADGRSPLADARVWFGAAAIAAGAVAAGVLRRDPGAALRCGQLLLVLPTGALFLATGGDDLPVLGLLLAAVALLDRGRTGEAGIAAGLAAAMKQTAWPVLPFLILTTGSTGRRRFAWPALGIPLLVSAPFVLWNPAAFIEDVIRFPLGLGRQHSAAGTPTLGSALIRALTLPRWTVVAFLAVLVAAVGALLLTRRTSRTLRGAVASAGLLMLAMVALAPSGRTGYLLYPLELLAWSRLAAGSSGEAGTVGEPTTATHSGVE